MENEKQNRFKIVPIVEKSESSRSWSIEQALEQTLQEIKSGEIKANKMLIVFLDDRNDYSTHFFNVGMVVSEIISLCEVMKVRCLGIMNYVRSDDNP